MAQSLSLPPDQRSRVEATVADWQAGGHLRRFWGKDGSLWTGGDEARWLGWLDVVESQLAEVGRFQRLADEVKAEGFTDALLLGMGGSSLAPEVLARTFGRQPGFPAFHVLDSTDPAEVRARERAVDLARTLVIVSSKSGSTLEPNIFKQYFFEAVAARVGRERAGRQFVAITDPGSRLGEGARADGFRQTFAGVPSIGGRYSALSDFGLIPAAIMGLDVPRLLAGAQAMARRCGPDQPVAENPGAVLGIVLGILGREGRNKVTLLASPGIRDLGAWLEQLLAESTGKLGKGLIPVDLEPTGPPRVYGPDRLFAYLRLASGADPEQDRVVEALAGAGQPVIRIDVPDASALGAEFFRWEMATAVAGALLGINPFDQPDVEASKVATRELTDAYEKSGALPAERPILTADGLAFYADQANAGALLAAAFTDRSPVGLLRAHLGRLKAGDYLALLAYVERSEAHAAPLQAIRRRVRDDRRVATCLGFGPRFLHSTGQAYKGGPPSGVFLQVTADDAQDAPVPGQRYTFGVVKAAQARGDLRVLEERGRRALRVHLGPDVGGGLQSLARAVERALDG